jgi:hypothetical protein
MKNYKRIALLMVFGACFGIGCLSGQLYRAMFVREQKVAFARAQNVDAIPGTRARLSALPKIESCVKHVKLVNAELVDQGGSQVAVLELENQANVAVTAIAVEQWMDQRTKQAVTAGGFTPGKQPLTVIAPSKRYTIQLGNLSPIAPIRIGSASFADGTEEGCESSLESLREIKAHDTTQKHEH